MGRVHSAASNTPRSLVPGLPSILRIRGVRGRSCSQDAGFGDELGGSSGTFLVARSLGRRPGPDGAACLDEFNRGPTAAIFGDTLSLLDNDKRSDPDAGRPGAVIERPYPLEKMEVAAKYANGSGKEVSLEVRL